MDKDKIWNRVIEALSVLEYPTGEPVQNDAFLVFQYYSEMESGGHEIFLNWFSEDLQRTDLGLHLVAALEKIGAVRYAEIEREYGSLLLQRYLSLEKGEGSEEEFYAVVEKADSAYYALDGQLAELLEAHFIEIYNEVV